MIVLAPDPVLRETCTAVADPADGYAAEVTQRLRAAMDWSAARGRLASGLAAPQIGEATRVFVLTGYPYAFVNPRVLRRSDDKATAAEGCLSLPASTSVLVARSKWVKLSFHTEDGTPTLLKLHGRNARAALHEIDHLDGILITDHEPPS